VVLGGILTTLVLNLFVLPALYLQFGASPAPAATPSVQLSPQPSGSSSAE
jgi:hypothetical protein